jgi:hypothetical protein
MRREKCVVLVPCDGEVEVDTQQGLQELERRGYRVIRGRGCSQIDLFRSQMASDFLAEGYEETFWIDSDVGFSPDDVDRLRAHELPISCGIYPRKGKKSLAAKLLPGTKSVAFGRQGGLLEIQYAATGFLHVRREVYDMMREICRLPICNKHHGRPVVPYFLPLVKTEGDETSYLSEDYSFCERARQAGYKIMADTTIRLWHIGPFRFSWEEAGLGIPRFEGVTMDFEPDGSTVANGYLPQGQ